ncbi:MAG: cytochrome c1 [Rhizobiaceae bacterium]|nr:cytochrome c1 [Rhizobiaceae bacterium]
MNKLLTAALAAGVFFSPIAFAQEPATGTPAQEPVTTAAPAGEPTPAGDTPTGAPSTSAPAANPEPGSTAEQAPAAGASPETSTGGESSAIPVGGEVEGEHETPHYPLQKPAELDWTFAGPFGHWDVGQLQRGLKVYKEVCSSCHGLSLVAFRNLNDLGYNEEQIKAFAAEYTVVSKEPSSDGEYPERPGIPADYFPSPYPNSEAAAASNNGAAPPDLSLMAKARAVERGFPTFVFDVLPWNQYAEGGVDYLHALLTGYTDEVPEGITVQDGTYYNPYFIAGPALAMPQPISDDQVTYDDGTPQTLEQYSRDVSAFLMWTAEPHLVTRKATGMVVLVFMIIFASLLYMVKRRVWADTPH